MKIKICEINYSMFRKYFFNIINQNKLFFKDHL